LGLVEESGGFKIHALDGSCCGQVALWKQHFLPQVGGEIVPGAVVDMKRKA
jgi:hypothetical protein